MKKILFHFTLVFLAAAGFSCAGDLDRFSRYSIPPEAVPAAALPARRRGVYRRFQRGGPGVRS